MVKFSGNIFFQFVVLFSTSASGLITVEQATAARNSCPTDCICTAQELSSKWEYVKFYSKLPAWSRYKTLVPQLKLPAAGTEKAILIDRQGVKTEVDAICLNQDESKIYAILDKRAPSQRNELLTLLRTEVQRVQSSSSPQAAQARVSSNSGVR